MREDVASTREPRRPRTDPGAAFSAGSTRRAHQVRVAGRLRELLRERGFAILNHTPLPLVCFTHPSLPDAAAHDRAVDRLRLDQTAWISRTVLAGRRPALRACVTSYETELADMDALVRSIERVLAPSDHA